MPGGGGGGAGPPQELSYSPGGGGGADLGPPISGLGGLGGPPNVLFPPEVLLRQACLSSLGGGGPSPNSAMRDMYSSSIAVLGSFQPPPFLPIQSFAMWPVPPQVEQTTLLVTLGLS